MPRNLNRNKNCVVLLNNIRSNENVGSIFRTADASGVSKIFLIGYTPVPIDRFGRVNKALAKSALGAEKSVEWEKVKTLSVAIKKLQNYFAHSHAENPAEFSALARASRARKIPSYNNSGAFKIIGVEQSPKSKNYKTFKYGENVAFVFGNEVTGLSKKDLGKCDDAVEIPMKGEKESLNVSVSAGIILYNLV